MGDVCNQETVGTVNTHTRKLIAEIIAELHGLYRDADVAELNQRLATIEGFLGELRADSLDPYSTTRGTSSRPTEVREVPELVTSDSNPPLGQRLVRHLSGASAVRIASAFLSASDTNPLIQPLRELTARGVPIRVLTSVMGFFNSPDALSVFLNWAPALQLRLYHENPSFPEELLSGRTRGFHAKTILIEKDSEPNVMAVGSANLTGAGMGTNVEWNYLTDFEVNVVLDGSTSGYDRAVQLFDSLWDSRSSQPDGAFLDRYREIWNRGRALRREIADLGSEQDATTVTKVAPNPAQQTALARLRELREAGGHRFAVIAATGVGKTILSAFEVGNSGVQRVLFLAHRRSILEHAREDYRLVLGASYSYSVIQGRESVANLNRSKVIAFAMVQTLAQSSSLALLPPDFFDYVILDEFHHAAADSYRRILDHFQPKFLLGMTATPERTDGQDVLDICGRTVAYEIRLLEAVDRGWLSPFQYFAIYDPTDYEQVKWTGTGYDEHQLEETLSNDTRADLVIMNLNVYQSSSGERRVLAFCSNVGHARWMSRAFSQQGIPAETLTAETPEPERAAMIARLQDPEDPLEILCTVDVLSEGVDIPSVTHVLMLRPTHSFTVFLQQLGRGLRHHPGKSFVVVLDFVGNYRKSYVAPLALNGYHSIPEKAFHRTVSEFRAPAGCYVAADTEVKRIWRDELFAGDREFLLLRRILEALEELADSDEPDTRRSIGDIRLPELFVFATEQAGSGDDIASAIRKLQGWLAVRQKLDIADQYEKTIVGTAGATFLGHVEQELKPNRSYKMAVLHCLLDIAWEDAQRADTTVRTGWPVGEIAPRFLAYYLSDRRRIVDWAGLAKAPDPDHFPIRKVVTHLKQMPLDRLSGTDKKPFLLEGDTFRLEDEYVPFWTDRAFRDLVRERVDYAEARYWHRAWAERFSESGTAEPGSLT